MKKLKLTKLSVVELNHIKGGQDLQLSCAGCLCDTSKGDMSTNSSKATSSAD